MQLYTNYIVIKAKSMVDKQALKQAYKQQRRKKNISALARMFNCSRTYVHRVLKERKTKRKT